jgi:hypothetical protein
LQPIQEPNLFQVSLDVHGIDWVIVFAYFDETFGGADNKLTAVAGYLFDADGVDLFRKLYQQNVEPYIPENKHGVKMFGAADCYDARDPYRMDAPIREFILARMANAIQQSVTMGVVVGIEDAEYKTGLLGRYVGVEVGGKRAETLAPWVGSKYSMCLMRCIQGINAWLDKRQLSAEIAYEMEAGNPKEQEEATAILARAMDSSELRQRYRLARYGFSQKGPKMPWFFAADYFAWEWQRYDRIAAHQANGEWRTTILPLIETKPHIAAYLTEASVGTQALFNAFYGLMKP